MQEGGSGWEGQKQGQKLIGKSMAGFHLPGEIEAFFFFFFKFRAKVGGTEEECVWIMPSTPSPRSTPYIYMLSIISSAFPCIANDIKSNCLSFFLVKDNP